MTRRPPSDPGPNLGSVRPQRLDQPRTAPPTAPQVAQSRPAAEPRYTYPGGPAPRLGRSPPPPMQPLTAAPPMPRIVSERRRPEPESRGGGRLMIYGLLAIVCVLAAGLGALAIGAPTGLVRDTLVDAVKRQTGRDLAIAGDITIGFFPRLTATLNDVALSAPAGMKAEPTVKMAALEASLGLWPLLKREVVIDRLVLRNPRFDLRIDRDGRRSWDLAKPARKADQAPARRPTHPLLVPVGFGGNQQQAAADPSPPPELEDFIKNSSNAGTVPVGESGAPILAIHDLSLSDVRIAGGEALFTDERTGIRENVTAINLTLALADIRSPLTSSGSLEWRREQVALEGRLGSLASLLGARPAPIKIKLGGRLFTGDFEGMLATANGVALDGRLSLASSAPRAFAAWIGAALVDGPGLQTASIGGQLQASQTGGHIEGATLVLDDIKATGSLNLDLASGRARVKTLLKIDRLDLTPYMAAAAVKAGPETAPAAAVKQRKSELPANGGARIWLAANGPGDTQEGGSLTDLIERVTQEPSPNSPPATARAGGSIQLAALASLDLEARVQLGKVTVREFTMDRGQLLARVENGVLKANIEDMALYEGRARGGLTLEPRGSTAALTIGLQADNLQAHPFLKDLVAYDRLSGRGKLVLSVTGQGLTADEILRTLGGQAQIALTNGSVQGADLGQLLKSANQVDLAGLTKKPSGKTDFTELAASFTVAAGIATTKDLRLASAQLTANGAGTIDMPQQQIDLAVKAKLASGEGAAGLLAGLEVPIRIHGPLGAAKVSPQLGNMLNDSKTQANIGKVLSTPEGAKRASDAIKKLLGSPAPGGTGDQAGSANAKDILNQFLKKAP